MHIIRYDNFLIASYGSPEKKDYWIEKIIKKHNLKINECMFIGDAIADYNAAQKTKIVFNISYIIQIAIYNC